MKHQFKGTARFTGGYQDYGTLETKNLSTHISIPQAMNGIEVGTNPDEMLLGAATTCFIISLSVSLQRSNIPVTDLTVDSEAVVDVTNGLFTYEAIHYTVHIQTDAHQEKYSIINRLVYKAEQSCMITRALASNVDVSIKSVHIND